jgi:hypothetical protein
MSMIPAAVTVIQMIIVLVWIYMILSHAIHSLGGFVAAEVFLFYSFFACFVLAGVFSAVVLIARWWTAVPFHTRRSCWTISVVSWALYSLCPARHRQEIADWMKEVALIEKRKIAPVYDVQFVCRYPSTCASPKPYTAVRIERVHHETVTCPGEAEVYVRARWDVVKILSVVRIVEVEPMQLPTRTRRRRSFWS